jgi:endonuclease/exonuclease/phosphatase (EEP) superfamily protein YafD
MKLACIIVAAVVAWATFAPMFRSRKWWIRIFDFPRIQVAALALVGLVLAIWCCSLEDLTNVGIVSLLGFCLAWQGALMLPYTPLWRQQVHDARLEDPDRRITLVLANVLMTNRNASRFIEIVAETDPDIVFAVETNQWWLEQLKPLTERLPHTVFCPLENTYGMLLFSRLELIDPQVGFVVEQSVPSIHTRCQLQSGHEIELRFLHPKPPFPTETTESAPRDAELLLVGAEVKKSRLPRIVAGDLNDVAWSRTTKVFQKISGLLDPRIGRGFFNTFHAMMPLLRFSLDHVFHSNEFRLCKLRVLPGFGSDHFPVLISLSYEPDAALQQPEPEPDREDIEEKHEAISDARND